MLSLLGHRVQTLVGGNKKHCCDAIGRGCLANMVRERREVYTPRGVGQVSGPRRRVRKGPSQSPWMQDQTGIDRIVLINHLEGKAVYFLFV